jgi:hypothetical protein
MHLVIVKQQRVVGFYRADLGIRTQNRLSKDYEDRLSVFFFNLFTNREAVKARTAR